MNSEARGWWKGEWCLELSSSNSQVTSTLLWLWFVLWLREPKLIMWHHPQSTREQKERWHRERTSGIFSGNLTCDAFYLLSSDSHSRLPVAFCRSFWLQNYFTGKLNFPFGPRFSLRFPNLCRGILSLVHCVARMIFCDSQFSVKTRYNPKGKCSLEIQLVKNRIFHSRTFVSEALHPATKWCMEA